MDRSSIRYRGFRWLAPLLLLTLLLALFCASKSSAQSPVALPNPNLNLLVNGSVSAVVRLPDGSIVFGGTFTSVNGTPRANIAKLLSNGTLDPTWNPLPSSSSTLGGIGALAVDSTGSVYVAGGFTNIGGQQRQYLAKLSGTGSGAADANWNPNPDQVALEIAVDATDRIYVVGQFSSIGGQYRSGFARLSGPTGTADPNWNPSSDGGVSAVAFDASGNVFVSGSFTSIGGQARVNIAKLSPSTGLADPTWDAALPIGPPLYTIALDSGGNVYSLLFVSGGTYRVIKLLASSGVGDPNWNPTISGNLRSLTVDASNNVFIGGSVSGLFKLSGVSGATDPTWNPSPNGAVAAIATDLNGNVYAGGSFTSISGQSHWGVVELTPTDSVIIGADTEVPSYANLLAAQPGGGMIVGGPFLKANGQLRSYLLRLLPDGTLDPNWNPSSNGQATLLTTDSSNNVYAYGNFTNIGGHQNNGLAKLAGSGSGSAFANWNPSPNGSVVSIATDPSANIYVAGTFTNIGGQPRNFIAKLSGETGAADPAWNPSANNGVSVVTTVAADTTGNIYVGGSFVSIGGQARTNIAKLSGTTGAADPNWNSSIGVGVQEIYQVATDAGGNVYASGALSYEAGHQFSYNITSLLRLTGSTGAVDPTWNHQSPILGTVLATDVVNNVYVSEGGTPVKILSRSGAADQSWNPLPNGAVSAIAIDVSSDVYVAGGFTSIGGQSRTGLAALSPVEGAETLTSSTNPSYFGQSITLTATVTGQSPTGTVTFNDNGSAICSAVALSAGSATCATSTLTVGAHALTAVYSGDANNAALTSASLTQQVTDSVASSPVSVTGLWYDPKFSGSGFNLQMSGVGLLITYYGWDATGNRLWLTSDIGPTALAPNTPIDLNMSYTTGGTFNNPQHNVAAWGTLSINFTSCHSATAVLSGKDGTQNLSLQQLTGVAGLPSC